MLDRLLEFWSFNDPSVIWVVTGAVLLGASAGMIGCFAFLQRRALAGDALAHAALPGVTSAFMLTGTRETATILLGACVSCILGYLAIEFLVSRTRVKEDSALAMVLSLFFAVGIFQLTIIQKDGAAAQAGLDRMLFGQAASLVRSDVQLVAAIALGLFIFVCVLFPRLKLVTFDSGFAASMGLPSRFYELLLAFAIVVSVVIGLQLVGVVLMAAMVLTPAAAARYWTDDLKRMLALAAIFGGVSALIGANISFLAPRMPTGPWMVVGVTLIFAASLLLAPGRGALARWRRQWALKRRVNDENLLRTLYKLGESSGNRAAPVEPSAILTFRNMKLPDFEAALGRLVRRGLAEEVSGRYRLTVPGYETAERITRMHRLWELYLSQRINLPVDHLDRDADEIEHILTPELEARLQDELGSPGQDPHGRSIPGRGR